MQLGLGCRGAQWCSTPCSSRCVGLHTGPVSISCCSAQAWEFLCYSSHSAQYSPETAAPCAAAYAWGCTLQQLLLERSVPG